MTQILISSSILILVLALLRKALRGKVSVRLQYALWLLVALRLLFPFQIGHSAYSVTSLSSTQTQAAQSFLARPITNAAPQGDAPLQRPLSQTAPVTSNSAAQQATRPVTQPQQTTQPVMQARRTVQRITIGEVLKLVWLCGVSCMAIWFLAVNVVFCRRARKNARRISSRQFPLPVYLTENVHSACMVGLFRPRVYLTPEAVRDGRTMRHVLTHEGMHYRHGDHFWALVRAVCLCIYWFDPLVWWAASLSRQDGELACDEGVLRQLGEGERIPYGKTLVGMAAEAGRAGRLLQTATTMKATKKQMKERIQMIAKKPKTMVAALIGLLLIVTVTVGCTFTGAETKKPDSPSEPVQESSPAEPETTQPSESTAEPNTPVVESYSSADGSFRIPQLALESGDAKLDNERILETFGENETASGFSRVDYSWAQNGDWVSLVVRGAQKDTGEIVRVVCNLDCESGAELTKENLYTSVLDSSEAYKQQLEITLSTYFAKELGEILLASPDGKITSFQLSIEREKELQDVLQISPEEMYPELVIDAFHETIYDSNLDAARLWLDENGDLWCCATVYLPQGGAEERELCLTGPTESGQYDASITPKVIELYSVERGYDESDGTPNIVHIPFLLAPGEHANEVNGEILRTLLREGVYRADYTWAVNEDILSIAVSGDGYEEISYAANIDLSDGTQASGDAVGTANP